jgi:hypothetical protein
LSYGRTLSNVVGQVFAIIGWLIVAAVLAAEVVRRRRSRQRS